VKNLASSIPEKRPRGKGGGGWYTVSAMTFKDYREYVLIAFLAAGLAASLVVPAAAMPALFVISAVAALPTLLGAFDGLRQRRINIDLFNLLAIGISLALDEVRSAAFIGLMLAFARLLDRYTESRTHAAIEALMKLKPNVAFREKGGGVEEIAVEDVREGDILVVKNGERVPVDGVVVFGEAKVNEAPVTGESALVDKIVGDSVVSAALVESDALKIRATNVGKDSTIERIAALIREAAAHKSKAEKLADRFAAIFLPIVAAVGLVTWLVTRNASMTAAIFLVACADDMAVAIPLAITASLGMAARRGVVIKGGEWLDAIGRMRILVLDKTGTLTYGRLAIGDVSLAPGVDETRFWRAVGSAEKLSEHPVGRALAREAARRTGLPADPERFAVHKGEGVVARVESREIAIGNESLCRTLGADLSADVPGARGVFVCADGKLEGRIQVSDAPRPGAAASLSDLKALGVGRIVMFTGDEEATAKDIAARLGIAEYRAAMRPEDKMRALEALLPEGPVGMIGDGVNDAPSLARADVGIAMGGGGTAVAVEAADVVILTDDLSRLPEMVRLGRETRSVVRADMGIWVLTNAVGFALVLTGIAGPAFAAAYNFATDFLPLVNSSRLFRRRRKKPV